MEHRSIKQLDLMADVRAYPEPAALDRRQRLERWAELLDRAPGRVLATLEGTEYRLHDERQGMRVDGSPLSVAFQDPLLRAAGLSSDTYGGAKRFFELTDSELHYALCSCHLGREMTSGEAARRVRALAGRTSRGGGVFGWLRSLWAA